MKKRSFALHGPIKRIFESYLAIIPIALMMTIIFFSKAVPAFSEMSFVAFLISSFSIGFGLWLFSLGEENSISEIGAKIGKSLFRQRKLFLIGSMTFTLGVIITIAEPDLKILATQTGLPPVVLITTVSIGVGLFFLIGVLRILFNKNLQVIFLSFYALIFALTGLVNPKFLPLSFDSGAVVTGPLTIPFILSFGAGLAKSRESSSSTAGEDSFGLTALVTAGPILAVLLLSLYVNPDTMVYKWDIGSLTTVSSWADFWPLLGTLWADSLVAQLKNLAIAILPLGLFYWIYDWLFIKTPLKEKLKILVGLVYSYLGMVVFLSAVGVGFLPIAQMIGYEIGLRPEAYPLSLILAALFGFFGVLAEPAVHVLVKQIETVSEGAISSRSVLFVMAFSVGGGMVLQALRARLGFNLLYYFIPLYAMALALQFFVPKIYANIAFDSGSIASGPMAASFVMPFIVGLSYAQHGADSIYENAFGTIAMVSAMPLLVIQLLGLYAEMKRKVVYRRIQKQFAEPDDAQVIHFPSEQ
jgi:hypothetical protein